MRCLLIFAAIAYAMVANAVLYQVPSAEHQTISSALEVAVLGDTVELLSAGSPFYERDLSVASGVTLRGEGPDRSVVIDGEGLGNIITIEEVTHVQITNLIFINGTGERGGALYASESEFVISDCSFLSNNADLMGGALYAQFCDVSVVAGSDFSFNSAGYGGGAIYLMDTNLDFDTGDMTFNAVTDEDCFGGGALAVYSNSAETYSFVQLSRMTITNNSSYLQGGAIRVHASDLDVSSSTFNNNAVNCVTGLNCSGGAIFANFSVLDEDPFQLGSRVYLYDGVEFSHNSSGGQNGFSRGSAIYVEDMGLIVENCSFKENELAAFGGAIFFRRILPYDYDWDLKVDKSEFIGNYGRTQGSAVVFAGVPETYFEFDAPVISRCKFYSNEGYGSVIFLQDCNPVVKNCLLYENLGILTPTISVSACETAYVINCTIADNYPAALNSYDSRHYCPIV